MTTALVTGGRGFIGATLAEHLRHLGWTAVTADRHPPTHDCHDRGGGPHVQLDAGDPAAVAHALAEHRPEVLFHLAGPLPQRTTGPEIVRGTVGTTHGLLAGVVAAGCAARVVLAGSAAQYGPPTSPLRPVREDDPAAPATAYGLAKQAAEITAAAFAAAAGVDVVPVRLFNLVGPGEPAATVAGALCGRTGDVLAGRLSRVAVADADAVRDFTDVRDIALGMVAAAEHGRAGRAYNLCSGRPTAIRRLAEMFVAAARLPADVVHVASDVATPAPPPAASRPTYCVGAPDRAAAELAWRAGTPLEVSVRDALTATTGDGAALRREVTT